MKIYIIDNLDEPELAPYVSLTEAQLRNRLHPELGIFVCESAKVIRAALQMGCMPISFLTEQKHIDSQVLPLVQEFGLDVPIFTGSRDLLASLTGYELSRGVLCAMRRPTLPSASDLLSSCTAHKEYVRLAVLDGVVNSENTGAIFRAAASLGIDALLLTRTCCDPLNRRACRVSMGTVFQIPWAWLDNYCQLRDNDFSTVAMALTDCSVPINHPSLKDERRLAIIMGNEGNGLPDSVIHLCDHVARIPMYRGVDSLNVAAAAAVAFYQLACPLPQ